MEISQVLNALQLNELPPKDVLEEILKEEVFHLRDYFLRNPVVKPLYIARIRKLETLLKIEEEYLFSNLTTVVEFVETEKTQNVEILEALKHFEKGQSNLRVQLASTLEIAVLIKIAQALINLQMEFEQEFKLLFENQFSPKKSLERVQLADQLPTGEVIRFIQAGDLNSAIPLMKKEYNRILLVT